MNNTDIAGIYRELVENRQVELPAELDDYDLDVICHVIQNKIRREHPLSILQRSDRLLYLI